MDEKNGKTVSEFNSDAIEERGRETPRPPEGGGKGGRGNADWQSAQYKESNGGKNATEGNKEDGKAVSKSDLDAINKVIGRNKQNKKSEIFAYMQKK